ncbi:hypothetical protein ACFQH2_04030 [Natronoarchaeum sp. GCM10025703]|uniref:hypothetical protein n=1 Tax=unclassified Natronoarchaeum TaxID=2620183 RepID=UPI003615C3AD
MATATSTDTTEQDSATTEATDDLADRLDDTVTWTLAFGALSGAAVALAGGGGLLIGGLI